jgi:hypothetical protein
VALLALVVGVCLYAWWRPLGQAQWAPWLGMGQGNLRPAGWAGALPTLLHVLAFGLLTAVLLPARSMARTLACIAWGVVNGLAECAQHPGLQILVQPALTPWPPLARYLAQGRFDPLDLGAALLGTLLALALLRLQGAGRGQPEGRTT